MTTQTAHRHALDEYLELKTIYLGLE